jgi:hypothetical protein
MSLIVILIIFIKDLDPGFRRNGDPSLLKIHAPMIYFVSLALFI